MYFRYAMPPLYYEFYTILKLLSTGTIYFTVQRACPLSPSVSGRTLIYNVVRSLFNCRGLVDLMSSRIYRSNIQTVCVYIRANSSASPFLSAYTIAVITYLPIVSVISEILFPSLRHTAFRNICPANIIDILAFFINAETHFSRPINL